MAEIKTAAKKAYLEHTALRVRDIGWHIRFFRDVLGMVIRDTDGPSEAPRQCWLVGGIQLIATPEFAEPEGRLGHLGVMCEDLEGAITAAVTCGAQATAQGRNWLRLPDGLLVELLQANGDAVSRALAVDPRAESVRATPTLSTVAVDRYYDDAQVGDECVSPSFTVTADHIEAYAELTGDRTPVHLDEAYARTTPFGTRVAHGLLGLALTDGLKTQSDYRFVPGMSLGWTWDFVGAIKIGDTIHVKVRVASMRRSKSRPGWGIVVLPAELINQYGEVVQRGEHRLMIPCRPDGNKKS